jgi:TatD DNase family protein
MRGITPVRFADSHCHITDGRLIHRANEIAENMDADGLDFIIETCASVAEAGDIYDFAKKHKNVYCTLGVHPQMVHEYTDGFEAWALSHTGDKKIVAYGEIGLDYYHMENPKDLQRRIFARQILLAHKMSLPIVIHTRDAFDDTLDVLIENKSFIKHGLLFHCFSESATQVDQARKHFDCYFAFGGAVTYTPADAEFNPTSGGSIKSVSAIRAVPLNRILLETDAPYLNPRAAGGKKILNEPKNVRHVAEYIAAVLNIPPEKIAAAALENTKRFFNIK